MLGTHKKSNSNNNNSNNNGPTTRPEHITVKKKDEIEIKREVEQIKDREKRNK
jgi:hypothetical protein